MQLFEYLIEINVNKKSRKNSLVLKRFKKFYRYTYEIGIVNFNFDLHTMISSRTKNII